MEARTKKEREGANQNAELTALRGVGTAGALTALQGVGTAGAHVCSPCTSLCAGNVDV